MITGATVLSGRELIPIADATVLLGGDRVGAVGRRGDIAAPDGAEIIDAQGKTLLPGFIDAHVHIGFFEPAEVLAGGVTTVRDLGWPPAEIAALRDASLTEDFNGPTIVAAGPMLTAPGGYPTRAAWAPAGTGLEVAGPGHADAAVAGVADGGFSIIKIALNPPVGPVLDDETLSAIVTAAHARGLKVTGHIYGLDQLHKALRAGVDELAHMLMSDELIPAGTISAMISAEMTVVPTLSVFSGAALQTAIANLAAFHDAGGLIVYGTDLGNEGPRPGIDPSEIARMQEAGMTGAEIIRSATVDAAAWLGLGTSGYIAEGEQADLILVDGDPLSDPSVLTRVVAVWRRGVRAR